MPRKNKRPSTQNEISVLLRSLKRKLQEHPENLRLEAIDECRRQITVLREEEEDKAVQRLTGIQVE